MNDREGILLSIQGGMDCAEADELAGYLEAMDGMGDYFERAASIMRSGNRHFVAFFYANVWCGHEDDLKLYAYAETARAGREGREPCLDDVYYLRDTMLSYTPSPFERGMAWLNKLRGDK